MAWKCAANHWQLIFYATSVFTRRSKLSVNVADGPDCDGSRMWLNGTTLFVPFVNITEDKLNETRNSSRASSLACIVASDSHQLADVDIWPRRSVLDWLFRVPVRMVQIDS